MNQEKIFNYIDQIDLDYISKRDMVLTVKKLKEFIEENKIPDDARILYHRIEDSYFNGSDISGMSGCDYTEDGIFPPGSKAQGWNVIKAKGEWYHNMIRQNEKLAPGGEYWDKEQYPDLKPENMKILNEKELDSFKEEYVMAHCCINYDGKNVYITAHY